MLNENIKNLRKKKGFSQEELAARLHVVRQTVSKWEKGLSVPDAAMIQALAQEMEVSVSDLLGTRIERPTEENEIALQLSRINEQMVVRNRRSARLWKGIGVVLAVGIVLLLALFFLRLREPETPVETLALPDTIQIYGLNMESGTVDKRIKFSFVPSVASEDLTYQVTLRQNDLLGTAKYETVTAAYSEGYCHAAFEMKYAYGLWFDAVLTIQNGLEERNVVLFEKLEYDNNSGYVVTWQ